ncbi:MULTISPECIES: type III-D CRISPR-associated protein Csx19 [Cohnella]|uniref:type III-D CRISPR-associated protein Csx19 n=1 Tax=Cohnella TaxID=329857 RepID=UPI0009BB521A|nr:MULTISPECIES: CRISPR-associated protein Csx19 [Cohnella]MBN2982169.1 hypothetical protein [Cohnella algarum]
MTTFNIRKLEEAVDNFLQKKTNRRLFALDYRDNGVFFGKNREYRLLFHDGQPSDWNATTMLRIFDTENEFYALKVDYDSFIVRVIEDENETKLPRLNDIDDSLLHTLPDGMVVFDECHELWGTFAEDSSLGQEWQRYTEARGNSIMLPVKLDRSSLPVYSKVRNYIEARNGSINVIDSRLCGLYYVENGEEKAV